MKTSTEELQTFVAIIDSGSITAAAEQLGQTVSGVSRALNRLERKLGVTLLRRTTRSSQLTDEGELLLTRARDILQSVEEAETAVSLGRVKPAGRLRVDAATPFMLHAIVPNLPAFTARYPDIQLELTNNERFVDLIEQRIDIAIRIGTLPDSTLHARALGACPLHILASPAYLAEHGTPRSVADLKRHKLLGFSDIETLNRWPLRRRGAGGQPDGEGVVIEPAHTASSGETLRHLALGGLGIVCLSDFMSAADIAAGRLVPLLGELMSDYRQPINAVYYRHAALTGRVQGFLDFLSQHVKL
ncbi:MULTISPECIES: LysR family transcriptional regulator [Burkholderia]|jgi:DNA-binding transcriptional LysR family regulator|uniref:Bacterial regulatory helix-turn-helix, lysR family protein n=1 Tax=Burkholderia gladioli TaxID=28095 RepID=A0AAW7RFV6_BURGA|nr:MULTISPECIES: LysR family transcriptional regulator [Burkholderia]AJW95970.1 bacterial regulatory helix-turn-helix, lysR family protein [Burkholderia gladioli]ASD84311.1 LysR family transcriptional regulator [Burkholderia gladioli pv. gladioli]AWY51735.1 LysR family transcriptional regulator [Burkholderia gladioli pv. gladioli]AYQ91063.1 LysR family transcriptional regulator [Burkholderia gladioli]KGC13460.1 bacterial regulatory helix-turn-helix, lysR family protein [Burkholderia gladioli]